MGVLQVRDAEAAELGLLATIWFDGWQDAHADILPPELKRARTLRSFGERLRAIETGLRVAGPQGAPTGFCIVKGDELYQLYVSATSRGSGIAAALVRDAETRIADVGARTAWLACAIGNDRAAHFYEKCGWRRRGTMLSQLETPDGLFPLEVWRYEKILTGRASS